MRRAILQRIIPPSSLISETKFRAFNTPKFFRNKYNLQLLLRQQIRPIAHISMLKGTYEILNQNKKHLSPLYGAAFDCTGLRNLYIQAQEGITSATSRLVSMLFYKQGAEFRSTQNKSLPAYSLSIPLLTHIIYHLNAGTLNIPKVRHDIFTEWRTHHKAITTTKLSIEKLNSLLDCIIASNQECIAGEYPRHAIVTILLSFLYHKATTRKEILTYLELLNKLDSSSMSDKQFKILESKDNKENDFELGKELIKKIDITSLDEAQLILDKNLEKILLALLTKPAELPLVSRAYYGYKNKKPVSNCIETAFHNLFNILLFNPLINQFDFTLLPSNLNPNKELQDFYKMQDFNTHHINTNHVGQAFMNMVSGLYSTSYHSSGYELSATSANFIPLINHCFGSTATSLNDLSKQFSDHKRQIVFTNATKNVIDITIKSEIDKNANFQFNFSAHSLTNIKNIYKNISEFNEYLHSTHFIKLICMNLEKYFVLFSMVDHCRRNVGSIDTLKNIHDTMPKLHYLIMHFTPKTSLEACDFIRMSLPFLGQQPKINNYVVHVCNKFKTEILSQAVVDNDLNLIKFLLELDLDPNLVDSYGRTPLHHVNHHLDSVRLLLNYGANPNIADTLGRTPIYYSINPEIVTLLTKIGVDPNVRNECKEFPTPLFWIMKNSNPKLVRALLDAGANVNEVNCYGRTPIFYATDPNIVELLLEKTGGDLSKLKCNDGETPIHYMMRKHGVYTHIKILEILLKAKVDPNAIDKSGYTHLMNAICLSLGYWRNPEKLNCIKLLLEAGAKPNITNEWGITPLHMMAAEGEIEIVKLLLHYGADPNARDFRDRSSLHYAKMEVVNRPEILEALLNAGAIPRLSRNQKNLLATVGLGAAYLAYNMFANHDVENASNSNSMNSRKKYEAFLSF